MTKEKSAFFNTQGTVGITSPLLEEHLGTVIDNNDPLNLCRIRVFIPDLLNHDNIVWITRMTPTFPGVTYITPKIGERVRVWFRNKNIMDGVYGLDYTHMDDRLYNFKIGDYGFIDDNENSTKVSGTKITTTFGSAEVNVKNIKINSDNVIVSGNLQVGNGYTGSFATKEGFTVTVTNGIITDIA